MMLTGSVEINGISWIGGSAPSAQDSVCWYAAYTWVHHEKRVVQQLSERRVDCFLPLYRSVRRWKDRRKELELALFPGYVFVRMALRDRLQVLQLPSVVRIVSSRGQPVELPENEMETLRQGLTSQVYGEPHPYLKVGRRVRIVRGPLAGSEGILIRKKDQLRVVLSIDLIMRSVAIEKWGCFGISLSTSMVYCVTSAVLYMFLQRRIGTILNRPIWKVICGSALASTVAGGCLWAIRSTIPNEWLGMIFGGLGFAVVLVLGYAAFGLLARTPSGVVFLPAWGLSER